jgi:hypothetical protein
MDGSLEKKTTNVQGVGVAYFGRNGYMLKILIPIHERMMCAFFGDGCVPFLSYKKDSRQMALEFNDGTYLHPFCAQSPDGAKRRISLGMHRVPPLLYLQFIGTQSPTEKEDVPGLCFL